MATFANCLLDDEIAFHGYYHPTVGFAETIKGADEYFAKTDAIKFNQAMLANASFKDKLEEVLQSVSVEADTGRRIVSSWLDLNEFVAFLTQEGNFAALAAKFRAWEAMGATEIGVDWYGKQAQSHEFAN